MYFPIYGAVYVYSCKKLHMWLRLSGLMVSALDFGSSDLCSSPSQGHSVVFLGDTLYSHSASLHPGV